MNIVLKIDIRQVLKTNVSAPDQNNAVLFHNGSVCLRDRIGRKNLPVKACDYPRTAIHGEKLLAVQENRRLLAVILHGIGAITLGLGIFTAAETGMGGKDGMIPYQLHAVQVGGVAHKGQNGRTVVARGGTVGCLR